MSEQVICALAGCDQIVEQVSSGKPRRYCCPAHRKIAHRQRRDRSMDARRPGTREPASVPAVEAAASVEQAEPVPEPARVGEPARVAGPARVAEPSRTATPPRVAQPPPVVQPPAAGPPLGPHRPAPDWVTQPVAWSVPRREEERKGWLSRSTRSLFGRGGRRTPLDPGPPPSERERPRPRRTQPAPDGSGGGNGGSAHPYVPVQPPPSWSRHAWPTWQPEHPGAGEITEPVQVRPPAAAAPPEASAPAEASAPPDAADVLRNGAAAADVAAPPDADVQPAPTTPPDVAAPARPTDRAGAEAPPDPGVQRNAGVPPDTAAPPKLKARRKDAATPDRGVRRNGAASPTASTPAGPKSASLPEMKPAAPPPVVPAEPLPWEQPKPRFAEQREKLARRRAEAAERRVAAARERRAAAATLAGKPIPVDAVYPDDDATVWRRMVLWIRSTRRGEVRGSSGKVAGQMQEALAAAFHSLSNNRLRSLLTTTGIIAGVAAVIVLVALGDGMKANFDKEFSRLANQITVTAAKGAVPSGREPRDLTDRDVKALMDPQRAPDIVESSPAVVATVVVAAGQQKNKASLVGAVHNYLDLLDRHITAGRWFTPEEVTDGERGVILGPEAVNLLYGPGTPPEHVVGQTVRLSTANFKVQGVLESNGQDDNVAITTLGAARTHLVGDNGGKVDLIILKSSTVKTVDDAAEQATEILMARHNITDPASRDFNVKTFTDWIEKSQNSIKFLAMFIVAVAAISLFVGGVGVANIMLVSVTERTREIGIRKAVGAKTTAIMRQFLSEAVVLTTLGGIVGVVFGIGLTMLGAATLPDIDEELPVPILSAGPVLIAFGVAVVIGLLAGGYPAHRAARLRPIQALRFE